MSVPNRYVEASEISAGEDRWNQVEGNPVKFWNFSCRINVVIIINITIIKIIIAIIIIITIIIIIITIIII